MEFEPDAEPVRDTEPADGTDGEHDGPEHANAEPESANTARAKRDFFMSPDELPQIAPALEKARKTVEESKKLKK